MNLPTILIGALVAVIFIAVVARGIYNRRHGKGGCSCGCGDCPSKDICHREKTK